MKALQSNPLGNPFLSSGRNYEDLNADAMADLISVTSDIALVINADGVIQRITSKGVHLSHLDTSDWVGKMWIDTVTVESRAKINELVSDFLTHGVGRWRQVNHATASTEDVPVRYAIFQLPERNRAIAIGQDESSLIGLQQSLVEAQQSVEREYARLRVVETRYRLLFQITQEPVLILDPTSYKVRECNPAAATLFGESANKIRGRVFFSRVAPDDRTAAQKHFDESRRGAAGSQLTTRLVGVDGAVHMSAHMFRQNGVAHFLVRLIAETGQTSPMQAKTDYNLDALIETMPDAFIVTDENHRILTANAAMLDMIQMVNADQARGQPLHRWLGRTAVDFRVMIKAIHEDGALRNFATVLRGELGTNDDVSVSITRGTHEGNPCFGFLLRPLAEASRAATSSQSNNLDRSPEQLADLVGRVPMKDIVRDTTDLIERMCIEAALERTGDNRASAADILGLSRQSLYVKLRRFGISGDDTV